MVEVEIEKEIVTYQQVVDGYKIENDPLGLGEYTLEERIKRTFLENPNLTDYSKCMIFFDRVNGVIGGRQMFFPTKVKVGNQLLFAQSGSSLQTAPEYRQYAIGMDMINYPIRGKFYPLIIYGGVSKMAVPIYKALRFHVFEIPDFWQPRNSRFLFQYLGIKGFLLKLTSTIVNIFLKPTLVVINSVILLKNRRYKINKLNHVPEWVDEVLKYDNHKYSEVHDRKWMQWTLDNNFFGEKGDCQSFYEVKRGDNVLGFFMTKERSSKFADYNIDKVVFGNLYEWGTNDENLLSEKTILQLAMTTFSNNVDIVTISTSNSVVSKALKYFLSFRHGNVTIIVKDLTKSFSDIGEKDNWRLRPGYCDCPFY